MSLGTRTLSLASRGADRKNIDKPVMRRLFPASMATEDTFTFGVKQSLEEINEIEIRSTREKK